MKKLKCVYLICLFSLVTASVLILPAEGYIRKRYTIKNIVDECTNILCGTVTEVNLKHLTAKVRVEENLKGISKFKHIQMRLDVGRGRHPQKLIRLLKPEQLIIVFYVQEGNSIKSLAHVKGTWFQIMARDHLDKDSVWWGLTHIEIYLNGSKTSKRTSTAAFQKELRELLNKKTFRLLFLKAKESQAESRAVSMLASVGKYEITYQEIAIPNFQTVVQPALLDASSTDILWIGYKALSNEQHALRGSQEEIKTFVENGGVVIISGQDNKISALGLGTEGLSGFLAGVKSPTRGADQFTQQNIQLFKQPNLICSSGIVVEDGWDRVNDKYEILATTNEGKKILAMLKYGRGIYLMAILHNETYSDVSKNRLFLENLIYFACEFLAERQRGQHLEMP